MYYITFKKIVAMQVNKILFNTVLPILLSFFKCEHLILIYINSIPLQSLWQKKKKKKSVAYSTSISPFPSI